MRTRRVTVHANAARNAFRRRQRARIAVGPPVGRRLPGLGVHLPVVDPGGPQSQRFLHPGQIGHVVPDRIVGVAVHLDQELPSHRLEHTFDLPLPSGWPGPEWVTRIPSRAQVRDRASSVNGAPLSTYRVEGMPRWAMAWRNRIRNRAASSW